MQALTGHAFELYISLKLELKLFGTCNMEGDQPLWKEEQNNSILVDLVKETFLG